MKYLIFLFIIFILFPIFPDKNNNLTLGPKDIYLMVSTDSGYHIFIKKKPGINSIMAVESTKDPNGKIAVYSLRAKEFNNTNSNEKRILKGKFLDSIEKKRYYIIDSTPEKNKRYGKAFHLFLRVFRNRSILVQAQDLGGSRQFLRIQLLKYKHRLGQCIFQQVQS